MRVLTSQLQRCQVAARFDGICENGCLQSKLVACRSVRVMRRVSSVKLPQQQSECADVLARLMEVRVPLRASISWASFSLTASVRRQPASDTNDHKA